MKIALQRHTLEERTPHSQRREGLCVLCLVLAVSALWAQPQLPRVYTQEHTGSHYPVPLLPDADQLPVIPTLPDILAWSDGTGRVTDFSQWERRRSEIAAQIQHYGIGRKPAVAQEQVKARMFGDTLVVDVTVNGQTLTLSSAIRYPKTGTPPYALMIGTSMLALPKSIFDHRPVATMNYHESQVNDYSQWRPHKERGEHAFDRLYPELKDNGAYSEWAWGISRLIDGLQQLGPEVTKIDTERIGVSGCSYAGKMALYCGAFDERIALTIAQEPGGGGAAAWRATCGKDSVENLDRTDYHWFLESQLTNFGGDKVYRLPYDQHALCAMVFPRALLLLGNPDYRWLADSAMQVSADAARQVWQQFGVADRFHCSIVGGHPHCMLPESQYPVVERFIDKFLCLDKSDSLTLQAAMREEMKVNLPLFQTKYTADPSPLVVGDTLFLYTSHDASPEDIPDINERSSAGFFMYDWLLWSTTDMANWTEHGAVASLKDFSWRSRENGAWAIQTVERNGRYYLYAPLHGHGIGVLVSDSPYGPFRDPLGKPLVWQQEHWEDIDPTVFVDDDGQAWIYWGNPHTYYAPLNDDMISLKGDIVRLDYHIDNYQEGPWLYKRKPTLTFSQKGGESKYYLAFATTCCPEALGYAMSDQPTGPWQWKGYIMRPTERDRGNHPGICDYKGRTYVFGQNYDLMHLDTFVHHERRSVSATEMTYNADGTIQPVPYWLDQQPLKQLAPFNPFQRVEAETMAWGYGLKTAKMGVANTGVVADMPLSTGRCNMYVYDLNDGEYIRLRGVDFGAGATVFAISAAASGHATVTLRLDSKDGPAIGTVAILPTSSAGQYKTFFTAVSQAVGVHDLFLCFSQTAGDVRLDWWQFSR